MAEAGQTRAIPVWSQDVEVRSSDVTCERRIRISTLLKYIQEATVRHTTALGMGRDKTLDKGLLWVITQQSLKVTELPGYDDKITVRSWPGAQLHLFFPRCTSVSDPDGKEIVSAKTLWVLMDEKTRKPVFPAKYGVAIAGEPLRGDFPLPRVALPSKDIDQLIIRQERTALYSECDINGHMNNSEYFDLLDDMREKASEKNGQPADMSGSIKAPFEIRAEYIDEIPYKTSYVAELYRTPKGFLLQGLGGEKADRPLFRIRVSKL